MVDAEITLNLEKSQRHHSFSYKIAQTVPLEGENLVKSCVKYEKFRKGDRL